MRRHELLRAACAAEQFESERDARTAVKRLFDSGIGFRGNVTSVLAELLVLRRYPAAKAFNKADPNQFLYSGCDFFLRGKRYEVKSVGRANGKFLLNLGPHGGRPNHRFGAPHVYVFVRFLRIETHSARDLLVTYDTRVFSGRRLKTVFASIRKRRGQLARFGSYIKLLPSDLGFPNLRNSRAQRRGATSVAAAAVSVRTRLPARGDSVTRIES